MNMHALARQSTVLDIVAEYEEKRDAVDAQVEAFNAAASKLEMAAVVQGKFVAPVFRSRPEVSAAALKTNLLKSGWKALYDRCQIDRIAGAKDKRDFERTLEAPPALTPENARELFGDYLLNARHHILRGLADAPIC